MTDVPTYPDSIVLDVTAEDIERGRAEDAHKCPLALAGRRRFPGLRVAVLPNYFCVRHWRDKAALYSASHRMGQYMKRIDAGKLVQPARFRLRRTA
jgi:hypothetical protein